MGLRADLPRWQGLLTVGGWAALGSVALTVSQVVVFVIWPPPETVPEIFDLMVEAPVLGLLSLDAVYLVNNLLVLLVYLGLAVVLWPTSRSAVALMLSLGLLQMSAYYSSNPAVEMLVLARSHADASTPGEQDRLLAAATAVLTSWTGTAFLVYYFLGAFVLLVIAWLLRRSAVFSPAVFWWALAAGLLMLVPSPFGIVGLTFAVASLVPWSVFCYLVGRRLLALAQEA